MGQPSRQGSALFSVRLELWRSTGPPGPDLEHLVDEMGFEPTTSSLRTVGKIS